MAVVDPGDRIPPSQARRRAGRHMPLSSGDGRIDEQYDGLTTAEFKQRITADLTQTASAGAVNYKLRDWLFRRQRFWGEPFPVLHELDSQGKPTGLKPPCAARPAGRSAASRRLQTARPPRDPLDKRRRVALPRHRRPALRRETNTMPKWAGSCWYYCPSSIPRTRSG